MFFDSQISKSNNAEMIRVAMPLIIVVLILLVIKKFFSSAFSGITGGVKDALGFFAPGTDMEKESTKNVAVLISDLYNLPDNMNPFNPSYMDGKKGALITVAVADKLAEQVKDAVGWGLLEPDYVEIFEAFEKLNSKLKVSWMSTRFRKKYAQDLLNFLDEATVKRSPTLRTQLFLLVKKVNALPSVN